MLLQAFQNPQEEAIPQLMIWLSFLC